MYTRFNFFKHTFAIFQKVQQPTDFVKPHYVSKHGSRYFFTTNGVYRYSNHWGRVGNCRWRLNGIDFKQQTIYWGFCTWDKFYKNNETDALFFIEKVENNRYSYNHILNTTDTTIIKRNANETAKVLKKINEILTEDSWAKHLDYNHIDEVRSYFIEQLITTKKTFLEIKKQYIAI